ncbi:unnamed protein product, partial [Closterium sp. NIES-53]
MTIGPQERDAARNLVSSAHFSWMLQYAIDYAICRCAVAADAPLDDCHVAEAARMSESAEVSSGTARRSAVGDEREGAAAGKAGFADQRGAIPASISDRSAVTTDTSGRNSLSSAPEAGGLIAAEDSPQRSANLSDNILLCDSQYNSDRSGPLVSARDDARSSRAKSYRRSATLGATDLHRIISATGSRRLRGNTGSDKERSGSGKERGDRDTAIGVASRGSENQGLGWGSGEISSDNGGGFDTKSTNLGSQGGINVTVEEDLRKEFPASLGGLVSRTSTGSAGKKHSYSSRTTVSGTNSTPTGSSDDSSTSSGTNSTGFRDEGTGRAGYNSRYKDNNSKNEVFINLKTAEGDKEAVKEVASVGGQASSRASGEGRGQEVPESGRLTIWKQSDPQNLQAPLPLPPRVAEVGSNSAAPSPRRSRSPLGGIFRLVLNSSCFSAGVKEGMAEQDAGKGNRKRTASTGGGSGSALSSSKTSSSECVGGWNRNFESGGGTKKTDSNESGLKSRVAGGSAAARVDRGLVGAEAGKSAFQNVQQPQQQQKKDGDGKVNVIVEGGVAPEDIFGFLRDSRLTATVAKEGPFGAPQKPLCSNTAAQTPQALQPLQAPQAAPQAAQAAPQAAPQAAQAPPASQPPQGPQAPQDPPDLFDFLRDPRLKATMPKGGGAWITTAAAGAAGAAGAAVAAAAPAGAATDAPLSSRSPLHTNLHVDVSGEGAICARQGSAERISPMERDDRGSRQHQDRLMLSNPGGRKVSASAVSASAPTSPRAATKPALLFPSLTPPTHLSPSLGKGSQEGGEGGVREGMLGAEWGRKAQEHVQSGFLKGLQQVPSGEQQQEQQQQGRKKKGMVRCISMGLAKISPALSHTSRRDTSDWITDAAAAFSDSGASDPATATDNPAADAAGVAATATGPPATAPPLPADAATGAGSGAAVHTNASIPSAPLELQMRPLAAHMRAASFSSHSSLSMRESPVTTTLATRAGSTNSRDPKRALGKSSSYETGSAVSSRVVRMPLESPSGHSAVGTGVFQKFTHDGLMTPCEDPCVEEDVSPPPLQPSPFLAAIISSSHGASSSSLSRSLSSLKPPAPPLASDFPSWQPEKSSRKLSRSQSSNSVAAAACVSPSPRLLLQSPSALSARRKAPVPTPNQSSSVSPSDSEPHKNEMAVVRHEECGAKLNGRGCAISGRASEGGSGSKRVGGGGLFDVEEEGEEDEEAPV